MGIELPPELADVAAAAGVSWPEADEDAMAKQAQAWRDTATSMSSLATDADTTARAALGSLSGDTATAAHTHWKTFVEPDTGHLTSVVKDANAAADRLEHAANQIGAAKVEIVRNLVNLAQNKDAANAAAQAGHPTALAGLDTAVKGTAANVAHIHDQLVTAVQPAAGVDIATVQTPVNANPGHHLQPGVTTDAVAQTVTDAGNLTQHVTGGDPLQPGHQTAGVPGVGTTTTGGASDLLHHGTDLVGDTADQVLPGDPANQGLGHGVGAVTDTVGHVPGAVADTAGHVAGGPGHPGGPDLPADLGDPEITGPVPAHHFPGVDAPTPPTGQTVQAGFAGGLEPAAVQPAPVNLPPAAAAPPLAQPQVPAFGGNPGFAAPPVPGAPPVLGAPAHGVPAGPTAQPAAPARPTAFAPAAAPVPTADRPQDPVPRKHVAGPPGAPPPAKGERDEVLAAFWIHMFPIGHLPVASYRPARQLPPPPPELDYAAGLRFEPGDHPQSHLVDASARLAELRTALSQRETGAPPAETRPGEGTVPTLRPVTPSAGLTADHPTVQSLLDNHDPLGDINERDWDRRYLVRLGSITAHGISPEGLEYNWPTSEQYPEGGSAEGEAEVLAEDTVIDRFGTPHGRVFAADGTPFAQRSLPPAHKDTGYRRYRIVKPLPVWRAVSAAWFGQPGGGVRYRTTHSAAELVALGYIEEIA